MPCRRLVDAAHAHGLAMALDVVYNHLGPEGNYLGEYGPYFTEKYRTPWGEALNFDDAQSDSVRHFFIENALYWLKEFHFDALRLDAIHGIFDFSAWHILKELQDGSTRAGHAARARNPSDRGKRLERFENPASARKRRIRFGSAMERRFPSLRCTRF